VTDFTLADTADALRFGLARGYLSVADVMSWARASVIGGDDDRAPLLGELLRVEGEGTTRILLILAQLAWGADPERVGRIAAGHLFDRLADGRLDAPEAARAMYYLLRDGFAPDPGFEAAARRFDGALGGSFRRVKGGAEVETELLRFLARYGPDARPDESEPESVWDERDRLLFSVERSTGGQLELTVHCTWEGWSGRARLVAEPDTLAAFARELAAFATHGAADVRLALDGAPGKLELAVTEYGRARRAGLGLTLATRIASPDRIGAGNELVLSVPTEHELLGEFAADLAELVSSRSGSARLRLLRRWPVDPGGSGRT
jgi:hypothetical protein